MTDVLPSALVARHALVACRVEDGAVVVESAARLGREAIDELSFAAGKPVRQVAAAPGAEPPEVARPIDTGALAGLRGPVPDQIDRLLDAALDREASDIHLEPYTDRLRVRFRVDGVLREVAELDPGLRSSVAARIKVMAGLDVAERRRPQDGRLRLPSGVDVRVSTIPTQNGEKVVLRLLDRTRGLLSLSDLGFSSADLRAFSDAVRRTHGMVLVTGPTGSGKTTTLYAALNALSGPDRNVLTIEDPIEYSLGGVNQSQAHPEIGYTFPVALRAFLRQDPDVILVGEIRDAETAEVAVRAALTGHLVLSTLHTTDAVSSVPRLIDLNVPPYLVAASLRLSVAQRLVRRVCQRCSTSGPGDPVALSALDLPASTTVSEGKGCPACGGTGFRGRRGLFELFYVDPETADSISSGTSIQDLRATSDTPDLRAAGRAAVLLGQTTPEEVLRQIA